MAATVPAVRGLPPAVERWRDPAVAGALTVLAVVDVLGTPPLTGRLLPVLALTAGVNLPMAVRRRFPLGAPMVTIACFASTAGVDAGSGIRLADVVALALAMWTMGRHCDDRRLAAGVVWFAAGALIASELSPSGSGLEDVLFGLFLYLCPLVAGRAVRLRQAHLELVTEQADRDRRDQARRVEEAVDEERDRIARELHDIVMHSISVIAVQTQAIRRRLGPEHAREAADLTAVETTAREAMAEMRRLFGVLRAGDGPPQLAPQPGLAQLDRLLDDFRRAGLRLETEIEHPDRPLTAGVDLTAYRVLQEALTNALKHAGPGTPVHVVVRPGPADLALEISDAGPGPRGRSTGGHGLIGMRERVSVFGGTLDVGRSPSGGFRVAVRLPTAEAVPA